MYSKFYAPGSEISRHEARASNWCMDRIVAAAARLFIGTISTALQQQQQSPHQCHYSRYNHSLVVITIADFILLIQILELCMIERRSTVPSVTKMESSNIGMTMIASEMIRPYPPPTSPNGNHIVGQFHIAIVIMLYQQ